jgi:cytochrome c oxidase cbb3-type subunit 1
MIPRTTAILSTPALFFPVATQAKSINEGTWTPVMFAILTTMIILAGIVLWLIFRISRMLRTRKTGTPKPFNAYLETFTASDINNLLKVRTSHRSSYIRKANLILVALLLPGALSAQSSEAEPLYSQPGILITIVLIVIPLLVAVILLIARINKMLARHHRRQQELEAQRLADYLLYLEGEEIEHSLLKKRSSLESSLTHFELSGLLEPEDRFGVIQRATSSPGVPFVAPKKKAVKRPHVDPRLSKLILWYLGTAVFWLVFGTSIGEYLGIKFVSPDIDHQSWLSFGRLRPVHTNAVFWGWSSLAMLGLGYYVVSTVSNRPIASLKKGWLTLILINTAVLSGSLLLMGGINNGGGEYREYVWPVMLLFGAGLAITLINFIQTIAARATREIYISNWYIVSAIIFTMVIAFVAYWPTWQSGLGETIVQGYWMHQGVGMWFMLFTLGIVYYFLPQQLNKPIYSYSLGILAFWTQILFYTVIGTHHFVFSSIPWSLQTVAIVGSMGMVIPVVAGTTNFLMTIKGDFHRIGSSYTLPFFLVGIVFYFTGSFQGTAEAFRYTNLLWHFTDFTVAHSHITMYGIIAFFLWGSMYAVVPRLTGNEPRQLMVGAHFWFAFVGLLLYSIPLMIGGTLKGLMWMDGKPFLESVTMMAPYWLWRAIGGTMMWTAHLIFAWNFYQMAKRPTTFDVTEMALSRIKALAEEAPTTVVN